MNNDLQILLINLLSNSNMQGWIRDYDSELHWSYQDGTRVVSLATEHNDVSSWLETYDELSDKIVSSIDGIGFTNPAIEEILESQGNLIEFNFNINYKGNKIIYHYVQFGDGCEAARSIVIPTQAIESDFADWIDNAIKNDWSVVLSE